MTDEEAEYVGLVHFTSSSYISTNDERRITEHEEVSEPSYKAISRVHTVQVITIFLK
jgi:hypothetical protein